MSDVVEMLRFVFTLCCLFAALTVPAYSQREDHSDLVNSLIVTSAATIEAAQRTSDQQIEALYARVNALRREVTNQATQMQRERAELAQVEAELIERLAAQDIHYQQEIQRYADQIEPLLETPTGRAALRLFDSGETQSALGQLDGIIEERSRSRDIDSYRDAFAVMMLARDAALRGEYDWLSVIDRIQGLRRFRSLSSRDLSIGVEAALNEGAYEVADRFLLELENFDQYDEHQARSVTLAWFLQRHLNQPSLPGWTHAELDRGFAEALRFAAEQNSEYRHRNIRPIFNILNNTVEINTYPISDELREEINNIIELNPEYLFHVDDSLNINNYISTASCLNNAFFLADHLASAIKYLEMHNNALSHQYQFMSSEGFSCLISRLQDYEITSAMLYIFMASIIDSAREANFSLSNDHLRVVFTILDRDTPLQSHNAGRILIGDALARYALRMEQNAIANQALRDGRAAAASGWSCVGGVCAIGINGRLEAIFRNSFALCSGSTCEEVAHDMDAALSNAQRHSDQSTLGDLAFSDLHLSTTSLSLATRPHTYRDGLTSELIEAFESIDRHSPVSGAADAAAISLYYAIALQAESEFAASRSEASAALERWIEPNLNEEQPARFYSVAARLHGQLAGLQTSPLELAASPNSGLSNARNCRSYWRHYLSELGGSSDWALQNLVECTGLEGFIQEQLGNREQAFSLYQDAEVLRADIVDCAGRCEELEGIISNALARLSR